MSVIKKMRRQYAIYWAKNPEPNEFGAVSWETPVEIKCRWEDKEGKVLNENDEITESMSTVYVDRPMKLGDKLKLGRMDTNTPQTPGEDRLAFEIQGFEKLPNFKAKEFLYTAYL